MSWVVGVLLILALVICGLFAGVLGAYLFIWAQDWISRGVERHD